MEDIELVIKMPESTYRRIQALVNNDVCSYAMKIIANGTQLPKGHGDLIDADALMEYCQNHINKTVDCNDIARFPIIIEANKAESEET